MVASLASHPPVGRGRPDVLPAWQTRLKPTWVGPARASGPRRRDHPGPGLPSTPVGSAAVLYVQDVPLLRAFYAACFELTVVEETEDYCVLDSGSWSLSLVAVPAHVAAHLDPTRPPTRRENAPIKLAFGVPSIDDLRPVAAGLGGRVDPADTQWEFRGHRHCDAVDPEGNVVQLREAMASTFVETAPVG
jgi:predicted enzyme related to lactoylglutathione lyase